MLHTLLRRNLLPAEHAVAKIKRFFASGGIPPNAMQQMGNEPDPIQDQQSVRVSIVKVSEYIEIISVFEEC